MKVNFRAGDTQQQPVREAQAQARVAKPKTVPVLRILIITALSLATLILMYLVWTHGEIATYGVIETHDEIFTTPVASRIDAVYAEPGDRVRAGDVLYVLVSDEAKASLRQSMEERHRQQMRLAALEGAPMPPMPEVRPDAGRASTTTSPQPGSPPQGRPTQVADDPNGLIAASEVEVAHRRELLAHAQSRLAQVKRLRALDAAVEADVDHAVSDRDDAVFQLKIAALALQNHQRERDQAMADCRSRIAALTGNITNLTRLAGPTEVRTLVDGVVADVGSSQGSEVGVGTPVMRVVESGECWVETYLTASEARRLPGLHHARVYPVAGGKSRNGTLTSTGGIEAPLPAVLKEWMPKSTQAIRIRIDIEDPTSLVPGSVARVTLH